MMKSLSIKANPLFIGRKEELQLISNLSEQKQASILTIYGRRRTGKTELIEQGFRNRKLLKFEGLEKGNPSVQRKNFLHDLARYSQDPMIAKLQLDTWREVFELLAEKCKKGVWTLYFEEIQWMANYEEDLISELKLVWDNSLKRNSKIILVLCGSSPSFMINKVIRSKALYNRSLHQIYLQELTPQEVMTFFKKSKIKNKISPMELMDIYLSIGGLPEYLNYIKKGSSFYLSLCDESFKKNGFFLNEYERILTSTLGNESYYREILEFLSQRKSAKRDEILKHIGLDSGGSFTTIMTNLELCGFIHRTTPVDSSEKTTLVIYEINDHYLQFYFKFIAPIKNKILSGQFEKNPTKALNMSTYRKWLGFAFERWCRQNSHLIAEKIGFSAIEYSSGAYFKKNSSSKNGANDEGFQIDLLFNRKDRNLTVCEIKYTDSPVGTSVISEFEKKLLLLSPKNSQSISRVLISAQGVDRSLKEKFYFDEILTLDDLLIGKSSNDVTVQ